jgi:hypothetical protein
VTARMAPAGVPVTARWRWLWPGVVGGLVLLPSPVLADDATCIAASEDGLTLRQHGKLHQSLERLAVCADASCPDEVKAECARRIDDVRAAIPTLILAAKDGAGNDLYGVKVSMDGAPIAATLDGHPLSIDPGEHLFVFEEPGQAPVERKLVLREGEHDRHEQVVIGPPPPPVALPVLPPPRPTWWTTQRTVAVVSAGVGLVGIGLGTAWGLYAISSQDQEKSHCSASACDNPAQAAVDYKTAHDDATASSVAFGAGAAFLAGAAVLWWTAPSMQVTPAVGSRGAGVAVGGSF